MDILARSGLFTLDAGSLGSVVGPPIIGAWLMESGGHVVGFGTGATQAEAGRAALVNAKRDNRSEVRFAVRECFRQLAEVKPERARFWLWHGEAFVKVTVRQGKTISIHSGGRTDEGYSCESSQFSLYGSEVIAEHASWGRDCDGGHEWSSESVCTVANLTARRMDDPADWETSWEGKAPAANAGIFAPDWERISARQVDEYAEAAGY